MNDHTGLSYQGIRRIRWISQNVLLMATASSIRCILGEEASYLRRLGSTYGQESRVETSHRPRVVVSPRGRVRARRLAYVPD